MLKALTLDQVKTIIGISERLNAKYPPSKVGIGLDHDITPYMEDSKELERAIEALSPDARMELMALMWLGREHDESNLEDAVSYARKNSNAGDVQYIAEKSLSLPLYLREGIKKAGLSQNE